MIRQSLPALTLVAVLLSACTQPPIAEGPGSSNPFVRNSATKTAAAALTAVAPPVASAPTLESSVPPIAAAEPTLLPTSPAVGAAVPPVQVVPTTMPPVAPAQPALPPLQATLAVPTLPVLSNEQRWRGQQENRVVLNPQQLFQIDGSTELWWFDPISQQHVILGSISGTVPAQARFKLRGQAIEAIEIPYRINADYGLTALSPAFVERMQRAGFTESVETYIFLTPKVNPA